MSPARVNRLARRDVVSTRIGAERARALAEALHQGQRGPGGEPLIDHVRRVAAAVPRDARVVAWLHEVLEYTSISEHALLAEGLSREGLRALRLLTRHRHSRSDTIYLAHVEMIRRASGPGADIARTSSAPTWRTGHSTLRAEPTDGHRPTTSGSGSCATHRLPTRTPSSPLGGNAALTAAAHARAPRRERR